MRNKAYLKGKAGKESGKEGKGGEKGAEHTQREGAGAHHLPPSGHDERQTAGHLSACFPSYIPKICLDFAPFGLRNSRGNTKVHQKFIRF